MLKCRVCKTGEMLPFSQGNEPEYTERYQCTECGHTAIIPSVTILFSQILSALFGGTITLFLFVEELSRLMTAFQFNVSTGVSRHLTLFALASFFLLGFILIIVHAFKDYKIRRRYKV